MFAAIRAFSLVSMVSSASSMHLCLTGQLNALTDPMKVKLKETSKISSYLNDSTCVHLEYCSLGLLTCKNASSPCLYSPASHKFQCGCPTGMNATAGKCAFPTGMH